MAESILVVDPSLKHDINQERDGQQSIPLTLVVCILSLFIVCLFLQSVSEDVSTSTKDDSGLAYSSSGVDVEDNTVSISLHMAYVFYRVTVVTREPSSLIIPCYNVYTFVQRQLMMMARLLLTLLIGVITLKLLTEITSNLYQTTIMSTCCGPTLTLPT